MNNINFAPLVEELSGLDEETAYRALTGCYDAIQIAEDGDIPDFVEFVKNFIIDELPKYEGSYISPEDLPETLTGYISCNGSFCYHYDKTVRYLNSWRWEAGMYIDWREIECNGNGCNPFSNPDGFMVEMVSEGVRTALSGLNCLTNMREAFKLSKKLIKQISIEIEEIDIIVF